MVTNTKLGLLNIDTLTSWIEEFFPWDQNSIGQNNSRLLQDLCAFNIDTIEVLSDLWSKTEKQVRISEGRERERILASPHIRPQTVSEIEKMPEPWCRNATAILATSLEIAFGGYWEIYNAQSSEVKFANAKKKYCSPPIVLRNTEQEFLVRYRSLENGLNFLKDLSLQFTSPYLFPDQLEVNRDLLMDYPIHILKTKILELVNHYLNSPIPPKLEFSSQFSKINWGPLFLSILRDRHNKLLKDEFDRQVGAYLDFILAQHRDSLQGLSSSVNQILKKLRVCCLTDEYDDPELWKIYGHEGTGIAFIFNVPLLRKNIFWDARQLDYSDLTASFVSPSDWIKHLMGFKELDLSERVHQFLLRKELNFLGEREWRIINLSRENEPSVTWLEVRPTDVGGIVCGQNVSEENFAKVRALTLAKLPLAKIYRCGGINEIGKFDLVEHI